MGAACVACGGSAGTVVNGVKVVCPVDCNRADAAEFVAELAKESPESVTYVDLGNSDVQPVVATPDPELEPQQGVEVVPADEEPEPLPDGPDAKLVDDRPVNEEGESLNKDGSVSKNQPETATD